MEQGGETYITIDGEYPKGFYGDSNAYSICLRRGWGDGKGLTVDGLANLDISSQRFDTEINPPNSVSWLIYFQNTHKIANYAFAKNKNLVNIEIPANITSLGTACFVSCQNLKTVIINDYCTSAPEDQFKNCHSLESAILGKSYSYVSNYMFEYDENLSSLTIKYENNVAYVATRGLNGCNLLTNIYVPASLVSAYQNDAFWCKYNIHAIEE